MRVAACLAVMVLAACSGGSTGMGGGTGGAGGGSAGGAGGGTGGGTGGGAGGGSGGGTGGTGGGMAADAGPLAVKLLPSGEAIFAFSGADASFIDLSRIGDAGPSVQAGFDPVLQLGPDGTAFTPAATAGLPLELPVTDAGVVLPFWALESGDGGREAVASLARVSLARPDQAATGTLVARVPHFTKLGTAGAGVQIELRVTPTKPVYQLKEPFTYQVVVRPLGGFSATLSVGTSLSPNLTGMTFPPNSTGSVTAEWVSPPLQVACTAIGYGTIRYDVTATAWQSTLFGATQLAPQQASLEQRVLCEKTVLPSKENPGASPSQRPRHATPAYDPSILEAMRVHDILLDYRQLPDGAITGQFVAPCGRGSGPCPLGVEQTGFLELTNALSQPVRRHGAGVMYIDPPAEIIGAVQVEPPPLQPNMLNLFPIKFRCNQEGLALVQFSMSCTQHMSVVSGNFVHFDFGHIRCGGTGDAVMLSDNTRLTRSGNTWSAMATGVTANVIAATDAMAPKFGALNPATVGYDNVTAFNSRAGFPRLRLQSAMQNGLFTHNGTRYAATGLVGAAAYQATDTLTVTGIQSDGGTGTFPDGGTAVVQLPAPPQLPAPNALFGAREGLRTKIRLPDGTFDVLSISLGTPSPRGGEGGLFRTVPASQMALDAGLREAPLLDDVAVQALEDWGLDAGTIYVAAYRQQTIEGFFTQTDGGARPVPVQAGRMIQISVPDLAP